MSSRIPVRALATAAALLTSTALLVGCSATPGGDTGGDDNKTIVVSTFPFGVDEFTKAIIDPFEKATGYKVEVDTGSNSERLSKLELNGKRAGADVMLISDYYAALGQSKKLFQKVDDAQLPNLAKVADFAKEKQYDGPAYSYQLNGMLYRTDKLDAATAAKWDTFGDAAHKGKLALPDFSVTAGQLTVSGVAETVGKDPYDVDASFKTLGEWSPGVLQFYKSSTEVTNLLLQGEIVNAPALSGFATSLVEAGEPIAWTPPATGKFMATNRAMIPANAENVKGAHAFINYLLGAEAQTSSAKIVGDLPVNPEATVPENLKKIVGEAATDPIAAGYKTLDISVIVKNRTEWTDRFAREVASR
ncbi:extracellular solute-binding protein [Mycetocola sp. JXN-3]|uniref:extracellular solute-binding protein n=1 Tax=Mycetocola sp. JXN-3 TaxID=2116510 RepID=UPI00165D0847|nr:extracellular solute-binding protein [Mycetocola sp. JXN-3]